MTEEQIRNQIMTNPNVIACIEDVKSKIIGSQISATTAAQTLLDAIEIELKK